MKIILCRHGAARQPRVPFDRKSRRLRWCNSGMIIGLCALAVLCLAIKHGEFRKFLAGSFFVSSAVLWCLWFSNRSIPIIGTRLVETPAISGRARDHPLRSVSSHVLFWLRA